MDSSSQTDQLLDLLYGELSPAEEKELLRAIDDDDELAEQWRQLQATREEVVDHIPPPEEVPDGVCDSILEAAAEQADAGPRRRGGDRRASRDGLWNTFVASGRLQAVVSAAMLLIVGGTIYTLYDITTGTMDVAVDETPANARSVAAADEPTFAPEQPAGEVADLEEAEAEPDLKGDEPAKTPSEPEPEPELKRAEPKPAEEPADEATEQIADRSPPAPRSRQQRAEPQAELDDDSVISGLGQLGADRADSTASAGSAGSADSAGGSLGRVAEREPEPEPKPRPSAAAPQEESDVDSFAADRLEGEADRAPIQRRRAPADEQQAEDMAAAEGTEALALMDGETDTDDVDDSEETDDTTERDRAVTLMENAAQAREEGDYDRASRYLDELFSESLDEELEPDELRQARRTRARAASELDADEAVEMDDTDAESETDEAATEPVPAME